MAAACQKHRRSGMLRTMIRFMLAAFILPGWLCGCVTSPRVTTTDLTPPLRTGSTNMACVLATPEIYRVQILIAKVVTNRSGRVELRRSGYRVGAEYFYPASSIKLCAAVAALQTIEQLQSQHHTSDLLETPFELAPLFPGDVAQTNDPGNLAGGNITLGQ